MNNSAMCIDNYNTFSPENAVNQGGCVCLSAILNYRCKSINVRAIYLVLSICYAGLSAPFHCDFSPYSDRPVNLALIQTQPPNFRHSRLSGIFLMKKDCGQAAMTKQRVFFCFDSLRSLPPDSSFNKSVYW